MSIYVGHGPFSHAFDCVKKEVFNGIKKESDGTKNKDEKVSHKK